MKTRITTLMLLTATMAQTTLADANCPANPKEHWMSELDMQKKIVNEYGFVIHKFKVDGECYEIYGTEANEVAGASEAVKIEVYFNTTSGEIVKKMVKN